MYLKFIKATHTQANKRKSLPQELEIFAQVARESESIAFIKPKGLA